MSDYGHEQTDKELKRIEKLISKEYGQAAKELEDKMKKHLAKFEKKDVLMKKKLDAGQITEEEYKNWRIGQIAIGERWKEVRDSMTNTLVNTDKTAAAIIQGNSIKAYGDNMNYGTYEVEHGAKINTGFSLYDENTVKNLLKEDPKLIPMPKVDIPKDELWNRQKLTSAVTQGILQGESIPGIAKRLASVADMDKNAAIRNARTYTTAAENKGRVDSYERAKDLGIKVKKKWIATLDDRTRVEHRHLDNMVVDNDAEFETDGYKISYPGDPSAEPEMIYNCRCTLVAEVEGVKYNDERNDSKLGDMTYEEWKHAKDKPGIEMQEQIIAQEKDVPEVTQEEVKEEWMKSAEYTPVKTIEEAEQYAKDNFVKSGLGYTYTGQKISYKGIDLDVANRINERLTEIYQNFDIPKLESLESFGKANKKAYKGHEDAPMMTSNFNNVGLNREIVGSLKNIEKYNQDGEKSFQYVKDNLDALTGRSREIAETYIEAGKQLVGNEVEDFLTHEIGHHIAYSVGRSDLMEIGRNTDWQKFATNISGYANHSFDEYIAESFNSYYRGETENLQPEMVEVFERLRKK